jgi:hypothetical protein
MNSLLQVMFMTPELRSGLFNVEPSELGYEEEAVPELTVEVTQTKNKVKTPTADESLVSALTEMGFDQHGAVRSVLATNNSSIDAALNYYLQHSEDAGFLEPTADKKGSSKNQESKQDKKKKKPRLIPLELQRLFSQLQCLNVESQSTFDLTSKGFQWQGMDGRVQHDAHELNRLTFV